MKKKKHFLSTCFALQIVAKVNCGSEVVVLFMSILEILIGTFRISF